MKKLLGLVVVVAGLASLTGCSDPCGDLQDCCDALYSAVGGCPTDYSDADSDACDAAMDTMKQYAETSGQSLPSECE